MIALRALNGCQAGQSFFVLPPGPLRIGRDPTAEIALFDRSISRQHARIDLLDIGYMLSDEGSHTGTSVNGKRIEQELVRAGDEISLGRLRFSLERISADSTGASLDGRDLGGYSVLELVGSGGMGTVYRAEQRSLERIVALKVLPPRLASDKEFAARFIREATAAGELAHPDILRVYDVDLLDGVLFYSMEFMAHGTVSDLLRRRGRLGVETALSIASVVARAVSYAEGQRMVHRDVKPGNLLIDRRDQVKLGDLGLAQFRTSEASEIAMTPTPGGICGTPGYMAPEQVLGRPVDSRADLFALGATLYELLSGSPPFRGPSLRAVLREHLEREPQPLHETRPDVPAELSSLCSRLLEKDPDARPSSARHVVEALERLTAAGPTPVSSPGRAEAAPRRRGLFVAVAFLAGLVAGSLVASLW